MAPTSMPTALLSVLAVSACCGRVRAFVSPASQSFSQSSCSKNRLYKSISVAPCAKISTSSRAARGRLSVAPLRMTDDAGSEGSPSFVAEEAEAKAAKLRAFAAELRAEAEILESQRDSERREAAQVAFDSFDTNDDGTVDVKELISGLEGQLRQDFVKRMTKKMGRRPTASEVDDKISEMPEGVLLPVEVGQKLIEVYDTNGDGVLQPSEFVPKEDIRLRLESIFADRAQEARMIAAEARVKEIEERGAEKARDEAKARGLPMPEDFNDGPPTALDKALCVLPYVLPLMDNLVYGSHIFNTYPTQLSALEPLVRLLLIYRSLPFSGLILFFGLQWFASKPEVNKLVRYNLRQAVNLDIAMFFPSILAFLAQAVLGDGAAKLTPLATVGSDIIFVTVILCVLYSIGSSAFGVLPEKIPGIGAMNREGTRSEKKDEDDGGDSSKGP